MDENQGIKKVLKWAGIVALVALPLAIFLKKRNTEPADSVQDVDEMDIYTGDFQE